MENHAVYAVYFNNKNNSLPQDLYFNHGKFFTSSRTFQVRFVFFFLSKTLPRFSFSMRFLLGSTRIFLGRITAWAVFSKGLFPILFWGQNPSRKAATHCGILAEMGICFRILGSYHALCMGKYCLYRTLSGPDIYSVQTENVA